MDIEGTGIARFVIYDEVGRVKYGGSCPASMVEGQASHQPANRFLFVGDADHATQYIKDGQVETRLDMPVVLNGLNLEQVPSDALEPVKLEIRSRGTSTSYDITGEEFVELEFPNPGEYTLITSGFPYKDKSLVVNV